MKPNYSVKLIVLFIFIFIFIPCGSPPFGTKELKSKCKISNVKVKSEDNFSILTFTFYILTFL